jgi:hypothetical protein
MDDLKNKIQKTIDEMMSDFEVGVSKDNKSAYRRARVASLALEKLLKEFRKNSPK